MKRNVRSHFMKVTKSLIFAIPVQLILVAAVFANSEDYNRSHFLMMFVQSVNVPVSGTVTDASGQPIPGVTVSVAGTTVGTATDLGGKYSLSVPAGSTLVFSFIGFETQRIEVGDRSVIDVSLKEDMASL